MAGLSDRERGFVTSHRVGRLATADAKGAPHVVPVCFALIGDTVAITIDGKPKRAGAGALKRLRNLAENAQAAFVVDRYAEDWRHLGWVMLRGRADILDDGEEHDAAQTILRARYPQLVPMAIEALPVIAIRIARVTSWGDLSPGGPP